MIIYEKNNKIIKFSTGDTIHTHHYKSTKTTNYSIELPEIKCSELDDAIYIQNAINTYVNKLIHDIMEEGGSNE